MSTALCNSYQKQTYCLFPFDTLFFLLHLPYIFRQMYWIVNAAYKTLKLSDVKQRLFFSQIWCLSWHLNRTNFFLFHSI